MQKKNNNSYQTIFFFLIFPNVAGVLKKERHDASLYSQVSSNVATKTNMNAKKEFPRWFLVYGRLKGDKRQTAARRPQSYRVPLRWRGLNADTGSSIEGISDVHLHKADSSSPFTFLLRPPILSPPPFSLASSLATLADVCFLLHPLSESTSTFCTLRRSISAQHAYSRCFAFIRPSAPLHYTFQPYPMSSFRHIPLIYPLCFSEELECFLYARISLLNLVHQVTILLLSPFSPRYFSCRYSTLLLFLVNAFVFVTRRTSGTSPLFFCIR